jgi:hypothetical protein
MARAAPATAGLAIAADARFSVDFFVLGTQRSGHAIAVEQWKEGEHAEVSNWYSYATSHIVEYQRVNPFLGGQGTQHGKAGGGREITLEIEYARAHLKKRRCHNWRL